MLRIQVLGKVVHFTVTHNNPTQSACTLQLLYTCLDWKEGEDHGTQKNPNAQRQSE
jgi:hypothetical protein